MVRFASKRTCSSGVVNELGEIFSRANVGLEFRDLRWVSNVTLALKTWQTERYLNVPFRGFGVKER